MTRLFCLAGSSQAFITWFNELDPKVGIRRGSGLSDQVGIDLITLTPAAPDVRAFESRCGCWP